jgi:hypothetical protein
MTKPVRFTISLSPELYSLVSDYADASGCTLSRAVTDWLETSKDAIEFTAQRVKAAKDAPRLAAAQIHAYAVAASSPEAVAAARPRQR